MALKYYNPTSEGRRQLVTTDRSELWKGKPVKTLTEGLSKSGGRNNRGRITTFHRGGGHKRTYRLIDFKRVKFDVVGTVERLEYDPNRTAWIALVKYEDGELAYIVAPQRLAAGDKVVSSMNTVDVKPGNAMPLERMPVGTIVHNIELKPARAARSPVRLVPMPSMSVVTRAGRSCASTRASSVACTVRASPPLAPCRTRITRTPRSARPVVIAGSAASRSTAV